MIRPLRNQVLLEVLPRDDMSGGVFIPENLRDGSPGDKKPVLKGIVRGIGEWRKTKSGLSILPDFRPGDLVIVSPYRGVAMTRELGERFRLCRCDDVLAVLT